MFPLYPPHHDDDYSDDDDDYSDDDDDYSDDDDDYSDDGDDYSDDDDDNAMSVIQFSSQASSLVTKSCVTDAFKDILYFYMLVVGELKKG